MKKITIIINSSPITTAMLKKIIATNKIENLVFITVRCDEIAFTAKALTFHSKDESYVTTPSKISEIFESIFKKFGKNIQIEVYTPCGSWLLCEFLYSLDIVKKINYIEEGLGGYSGVLDYINDNQNIHNYFKETTYSDNDLVTATIKARLVFIFSYIFSKPILLLSKLLWKLQLTKPSVFWFKIYRRSRHDCSFLGDLSNSKTGNFYTTMPLIGFAKNVVIPIDTIEPKIEEKKILILLPPSQHTREDCRQIFLKQIDYIISHLDGVEFYYKSHPADRNNELRNLFQRYFEKRVTSIDQCKIDNETSFWAYANGYNAIVCYQSAAMFYVAQLIKMNKKILSLDLSQEISKIESPSLYIIKQLKEEICENAMESTKLFLSRYKAIFC